MFLQMKFTDRLMIKVNFVKIHHMPLALHIQHQKLGSDHLVRAWNKTFDLPTLITNCSNNYGPYQFPEKLIPLTIINALKNKPLPIYGKG